MHFIAAELDGVYLIEPERREDERGYFARLWCRDIFAHQGLADEMAQCSIAQSRRAGTLRGLHYQAAPHAECKLVRCTRGAIYDVVVDLRLHSPTYLRWAAFELDARAGRILYVPEQFAHGYQTLADDTEVFYQMSTPYHPAAERGLRWNDPLLNICWPLTPTVISLKDRSYANFSPLRDVA